MTRCFASTGTNKAGLPSTFQTISVVTCVFVWVGGRGTVGNFTMEKPGRHHLSQTMETTGPEMSGPCVLPERTQQERVV